VAVDAGIGAPRHRLLTLKKAETIDLPQWGTPASPVETRNFSPYDKTVLQAIEWKTEPNSSRMVTCDISFLGLVNLQSESRSMTFFSRAHLTSLQLQGDWRRMAIGSRLEAVARLDSMVETTITKFDETYDYEIACLVESELPASDLHPALLGVAKRLGCASDRPQKERTDVYFYLEDYAFAVRLETAFGSRRPTKYRITEVRQE